MASIWIIGGLVVFVGICCALISVGIEWFDRWIDAELQQDDSKERRWTSII